MIQLKPINEDNYNAVIDLEVTKEQKKFVASNIYSLAEAFAIDHLEPRAIMEDEKLIGFLMYTLQDDEYDRTAALWRFMITPEYQGKGYGYKAMMVLIDYLKGLDNIDRFLTSYEPENIHAKALYTKCGMKENGDICDGEIVTIMSFKL
jgi:diamine N-acetyltransferase